MTRLHWTTGKDYLMHMLYPHIATADLAALMARSLGQVYNRAYALDIKKTPEFYASDMSGRTAASRAKQIGVERRFMRGHVPWNKGHHYQAGGRSAETQFVKGRPVQASYNYKPIGSTRISKDGYLERKINDSHPVPARRWEAVHRTVWQAAHGPIPAGHVVCFVPGMLTAVEADITITRLQLVHRAVLARRNHPMNKDPEYARLVQLKGQITRQVNRLLREKKETT